MKQKGFTLIELLAVIIILGIVITIVVVSVSGAIDRSSSESINLLKHELENAATKYVTENIDTIENGDSIYVKTLIDNGYLKEIKKPDDKSKNCYNNTVNPSSTSNDSYIVVNITSNPNGNYKYEYTAHLMCENNGVYEEITNN